ncbi:MAG: hypothetical protein AB7S93_08715 [Xanthobacteraceae bacterium]
MFLIAFPLLLVPFALYNMAVFLLDLPPSHEIATIPLPSDRSMSVSLGDALVALAMFLLYLEVLKAARFAGKGAMDNVLALLLVAGMGAELALVPQAQTSTFLLLTVLAFVDLLIGISVGPRPHRDIRFEDGDRPLD